ncbi:MAG: hypothetical protein GY834_15795 [Bacteroidetes bacterium]|nr:hypothetical protein [Bacteroidota bacterium]
MKIFNIFNKKGSKNIAVGNKGCSICEGATIIGASVADGAKIEGGTVAKNATIIGASVARNAELSNTEIAKGAKISRSTIAENAIVGNRFVKVLSIKSKYAIIVLAISVIIILVFSLLEVEWLSAPIFIITGLGGLWAFFNLLLNILLHLFNKKVN